MLTSIAGRVAIVTGASKGIGKGVVVDGGQTQPETLEALDA